MALNLAFRWRDKTGASGTAVEQIEALHPREHYDIRFADDVAPDAETAAHLALIAKATVIFQDVTGLHRSDAGPETFSGEGFDGQIRHLTEWPENFDDTRVWFSPRDDRYLVTIEPYHPVADAIGDCIKLWWQYRILQGAGVGMRDPRGGYGSKLFLVSPGNDKGVSVARLDEMVLALAGKMPLI